MHLSKLDVSVKCGRYLNHATAFANIQEQPLLLHYYCKLSDLPNAVSAAQKGMVLKFTAQDCQKFCPSRKVWDCIIM
jgi:hypothetical protein